ncbi:hypothetical protein ZWY2020_035183 [Hordeum vulgare]|nr:hypothetical protein ZWY2020_035183 [Hordeum vulgare]
MAVSLPLRSILLLPPLLLLLTLPSLASACDRCVHRSRAAYYTSSLTLAAGSCGYGAAAASSTAACSPQQARPCTDKASAAARASRCGAGRGALQHRRREVVVTDRARSKTNDTDLVLSSPAFAAMARPGMAARLARLGAVDGAVRVQGQNLSLRVEERSRAPNKLAVTLLYQGGQTDIVAVDVAQVRSSSSWRSLTRPRAGVEHEPGAAETAAAQGGGDRRVRREVGLGRPGGPAARVARRRVYDTGVQITDVAQSLLPLQRAGVEVR